MHNLLSNAIKYSPVDSSIEFRTELKEKELLIEVQDHGIGIPDEEKNHMFDRFFRASNVLNIEGTGLGLSIVKKYVELMNGKIEFTSSKDIGTTFTLTLKDPQIES